MVKIRFIISILLIIICMLVCGCEKESKISKILPFNSIIDSGKITMLTYNNANCYYQYQDEYMGFEYELGKAFADYLGVKIEVVILETWEDMLAFINKNPGSFMAAGLTVTKERQKQADFSDKYMSVEQNIIVHRDNKNINNANDLPKTVVHIRKGTAYEERLNFLKQQGINLKIELYDDLDEEEFIRRVAENEIETTIADSNIALLNRRYYPQVKISGAVTKKESLAWAVHPDAEKLLKQVNTFFKTIKKNGVYQKIYKNYYEDADYFDYADLDKFHRVIELKLPKYKDLIKQAAQKYDFDWRLIIAIIYQESHFDPDAKSGAGACGLMQITDSTAKKLGHTDIFNPEINIQAGVELLETLFALYDRAEGNDRLNLALAAYNIGQGHVLDARNLAELMNLNPNLWSSISKTLPLLMKRKYYKKSLYGYCRGIEPVEYVRKVLIYYDILKQMEVREKELF